jgi:photosystem II stability/assembly factor-like uncharacterized protein
VLRSSNGGSTWDTVFPNVNVNTIAIDPVHPNVVYVGTQENGIAGSLDGGATWSNISGSAIVAPISKLLVHPMHTSHVFAATSGQGVFYSSNQGRTWTPMNEGLSDLNIVAMAIQSGAPHSVLAATFGGNGFVGTPRIVPEPHALAIAFLGVLGVLAAGRRKKLNAFLMSARAAKTS